MAENKFYAAYQKLVTFLLLLFTFLLPLKFGGIVGVPEATGLFTDQIFAYLIISWPVFLFPLFSGIILLLSIFAFPVHQLRFKTDKALLVAVFWVLLAFTSLLGMVNATVWDFVIMQLTHLFGLAAYVLALYLFLRHRPGAGKLLIGAVFAGVIVSVYLGLEQYFSGFEEMREFIKKQEALGIRGNTDIKARVFDDRLHAPFIGSNSLAGYLLLTAPLTLVVLWNLCARIEPPKVARLIFIPLAAACLLFVFLETKARGAFLALVLASGVFIVIFPVKKWLRLVVVIAAPLAVVGGIFYIYKYGRGFSSMAVRVDYIKVSLELFFKQPLFGTGWGDFFYDYMRLKTIVSKEAPHTPHNILMAFGGQAGVLALLAAAGVLFYPLRAAFGKVRELVAKHVYMREEVALFFGFTAFVFHSLLDVDLQVPGLISIAVAMTLLLVITSEENEQLAEGKKVSRCLLLPVYLVLLIVVSGAVAGGWHLTRSEYVYSKLCDLCKPTGKTPQEIINTSAFEVNEKLQAAVKARPYSPFPYSTAGAFYMGTRRFEDAEKCYRKALELAPESAAYYFRIFCLLQERGQSGQARKYLRKACELFPHNPRYRAARETFLK